LITADDFDLTRGALLLAQLDDHELDVEGYVREVERMANEIRGSVPADADHEARFAALKKYLFEENGFHGSRHEYYHKANSYLNRVIDDREGIPITLSLLFMELGRRLDLAIEGIGLPGHFVARWRKPDGSEQLIDVFEGATFLSRDDAARIVREHNGGELTDEHLKAVSRRAILERMLMNLIGLAQRDTDNEALRRYTEALVLLVPDSVQFRGMRALARFQTGRREAAIADLDWFLEHKPEGIDLDRIQEMRDHFQHAR
jgi:serine protease Do